ncbi:MAG: hypothetical protein WD004_06100 [Actinomycetota bacterium]
MLELGAFEAAVVGVFASPDAVAAVHAGPWSVCRVAPDEAMVVAEADDGEQMLGALEAAVGAADPDGIVLETTDGWSACTLSGDASRDAFSYLSELELPDEGFVQGAVADVPVRVIVEQDVLYLFVPAMWGAYLRDRIMTDCAHLGVREVETVEAEVVR